MIKKLCLISCEPVKLKDKVTGDENIRYKYIFITEKEEPIIGWHDDKLPFVDGDLLSSEEYKAERARAYNVTLDSFNGKLTQKVNLDA